MLRARYVPLNLFELFPVLSFTIEPILARLDPLLDYDTFFQSRDVAKLGAMRDRDCKASAEVVAQSAAGNNRQEQLFALRQAVELFEYYQEKIGECEAEMKKYARSLSGKREDEPPTIAGGRKRQRMGFNMRDYT